MKKLFKKFSTYFKYSQNVLLKFEFKTKSRNSKIRASVAFSYEMSNLNSEFSINVEDIPLPPEPAPNHPPSVPCPSWEVIQKAVSMPVPVPQPVNYHQPVPWFAPETSWAYCYNTMYKIPVLSSTLRFNPPSAASALLDATSGFKVFSIKTDAYQPKTIPPLLPRNGSDREYHRGRDRLERELTKSINFTSLRKWEDIQEDEPSTKPKPGFIFTVMSYNVLAQQLLEQHPYLYKYHDPEALSWEIRWPNLLQEIKKLDPDILCLQEVQESHIKEYFNVLRALGYDGVYKKRTRNYVDGCAIYYKTDNIHLIEYVNVEYFQPGISVLDRDNVGLIMKFAPKLHPTKEFVVATTHLLYNPKREDVRLAQTQVLLTEVDRISFKKKGNECSYVPVVITGDFNALPNSNLCKFIMKGALHYQELAPQLLDFRYSSPSLVTTALGISDNCQHVELIEKRINNVDVTRMEEEKLIKLSSTEKEGATIAQKPTQFYGKGILSHSFQLKSVYHENRPGEGTTNQDGEWIKVDYIFYSVNDGQSLGKLKLLSRYKLPKSTDLKNATIPNKNMGSDHLSLIGKFKLEF